MAKLFIGSFNVGDQLDKNYYRIDTLDENFRDRHFGGLAVNDYVLPMQKGMVSKLFKFTGFETINNGIVAKFDVIKNYEKEISFSKLCLCKYFEPDLVLMNKATKATKGVGFHELKMSADTPAYDKIDFFKDVRRYFICLEEKLSDTAYFKQSDICVVISDEEKGNIVDIVEFNGYEFNRQETFWDLFNEKVEQSKKQYSLGELLTYADAKNDDAPSKKKYLKSVLKALSEESIFSVDKIVALYDNVIVGRKRTVASKKKSGNSNNVIGSSDDGDDSVILDEDVENLSVYEQYASLMDFNPNIILYGPPGTGKTYGAMKIIDAFEKLSGSKSSFQDVINEERAKFITFHQAFSYEEFVEGIRPRIDEAGNISYPVEPGVLKEIADVCRIQNKKKDINNDALSNTTQNSRVWKVSLGRRNSDVHIFKALRDKSEIAIGYGPDEDIADWDDSQIDASDHTGLLKVLHSKVEIGDIIFIFDSIRTIRLIGVVTSDYFYTEEGNFGYRHRRKVQWLMNCEENPINILSLNQGKQLTLSSIYELKIPVSDAVALIDTEENKDASMKPYYLIIDEINRGNIAKIFGELITLIEKDKREILSCTLPYSRDRLTLPKNLYIIGTMNTSDRSIALLDTALRRRFAFIELNPDVSLIEKQHPTLGGHVSTSLLLQELNNRITIKIDRDHRIGHSYFLGEDLVSKYDLFNLWYYKVLPLLMEYFYNDIKQVSTVVGSIFFDDKTGEVVQLSLIPDRSGISDFEQALIAIYERGE
nr:AAA family ATPase [uncultured Trichococcus sp.]